MTPEFRAGVFSLQPDEVQAEKESTEGDVDPLEIVSVLKGSFLNSL